MESRLFVRKTQGFFPQIKNSRAITKFLTESDYFKQNGEEFISARIILAGVLYSSSKDQDQMKEKVRILFQKVSEQRSRKSQIEDIKNIIEKLFTISIK